VQHVLLQHQPGFVLVPHVTCWPCCAPPPLQAASLKLLAKVAQYEGPHSAALLQPSTLAQLMQLLLHTSPKPPEPPAAQPVQPPVAPPAGKGKAGAQAQAQVGTLGCGAQNACALVTSHQPKSAASWPVLYPITDAQGTQDGRQPCQTMLSGVPCGSAS
jgi:hypothetical protein